MAKRRSAGEGTIYKLPSGNWRAQVSIAGRRISHTARSQQGARQWLRDVEGQIEQGLTYQADRVTLGEFMTGWLAQKQTRVRPATYQQYSAAWRSIQPALGRVKIKDLTPGMVQQLYDMLLTHDKRGARTVSYTHLRAHETPEHLVCRFLLEKKNNTGRHRQDPSHTSRFHLHSHQVQYIMGYFDP